MFRKPPHLEIKPSKCDDPKIVGWMVSLATKRNGCVQTGYGHLRKDFGFPVGPHQVKKKQNHPNTRYKLQLNRSRWTVLQAPGSGPFPVTWRGRDLAWPELQCGGADGRGAGVIKHQ